MNNINKILRESLIKEDIGLNDELVALAKEILTHFCVKWIEHGFFFSGPIYTTNFIKVGNYDRLSSLLIDKIIGVCFIDAEHSKDKGSFSFNNNSQYKVSLSINKNQIKAITKDSQYAKDDEVPTNMQSFANWNTRQFESTLVHELTHVFDAYRSNGKFSSSQANKKYQKVRNDAYWSKMKSLDKMTDDDKNKIRKSYSNYLNLKHEINARFNQALKEISTGGLFKVDRGDRKFHYITFKEFYADFIKHFQGWDNLEPKQKKRLDRRLVKTYDDARDEYNERFKDNDRFVTN